MKQKVFNELILRCSSLYEQIRVSKPDYEFLYNEYYELSKFGGDEEMRRLCFLALDMLVKQMNEKYKEFRYIVGLLDKERGKRDFKFGHLAYMYCMLAWFNTAVFRQKRLHELSPEKISEIESVMEKGLIARLMGKKNA